MQYGGVVLAAEFFADLWQELSVNSRDKYNMAIWRERRFLVRFAGNVGLVNIVIGGDDAFELGQWRPSFQCWQPSYHTSQFEALVAGARKIRILIRAPNSRTGCVVDAFGRRRLARRGALLSLGL